MCGLNFEVRGCKRGDDRCTCCNWYRRQDRGSVVSGQWSVVSGQWAVGEGKSGVVRWGLVSGILWNW
ncbi:MAG TPA: hypothetical protein DIT89_14990 [Planctomycetaceae bacterium]|nr:hypothetical protein [Planctomycetaceae bacterium]